MIDNASSRAWNVAEYFFGVKAPEYVHRIREIVVNMPDVDAVRPFVRYLDMEEYSFTHDIGENLTAGFDIGWYGFDVLFPNDFMEEYLRNK